MEMAFFLCTHCSFLTGSRLPNEGKGVARGGDPPSIAAYVLQRSRIGWPMNGRLHIQDMRSTSALRERQVEELHKEKPTPVADVARSGSYSEPRKLRLPLIFFQIPNHWRKCQERCRRDSFSHNTISFTFHIAHVSSGRERGRWGENMRHLALPQETEGRPATSLHVTHGDQNDPVNDINHHLNTTCRG